MSKKMNNINYCNNCGKTGHLFHNCKIPITNLGVKAFRNNNGTVEYLMIRRKETLGYIDFMRGKYQLNNKEYIKNMLKQMSNTEKENIINYSFDELWKEIWGDEGYNNKYKMEETSSKDKFNSLKTIKEENMRISAAAVCASAVIALGASPVLAEKWDLPMAYSASFTGCRGSANSLG